MYVCVCVCVCVYIYTHVHIYIIHWFNELFQQWMNQMTNDEENQKFGRPELTF